MTGRMYVRGRFGSPSVDGWVKFWSSVLSKVVCLGAPLCLGSYLSCAGLGQDLILAPFWVAWSPSPPLAHK